MNETDLVLVPLRGTENETLLIEKLTRKYLPVLVRVWERVFEHGHNNGYS